MIDVVVPVLGESITEATVAQWFKQVGEAVARDEPLCELETDKVAVEIPSPAITGNALADLLLGLPLITGGATLDNPQALRTESYNLFVQDEIRLRPNLTVSAGLRYEVTSPPVDAEDRANLFDPVSQSLALRVARIRWCRRVGLSKAAWTVWRP